MSTTISQALRRIKKLKGQLGEHRQHASEAVTHLIDHKPAYLYFNCQEQADAVCDELLALQTAVAIANAETKFEWSGKSVTLALAVRTLRELTAAIAWAKNLPVKAHESTIEHEREHDGMNWVQTPKHYKCYLPEATRNAYVNELQDKFDKLNDIVETTNHKTTI